MSGERDGWLWAWIGGCVAWLAIAAVVALVLGGCGASALVEHARAAQLVAPVITAAGAVVHTARSAELDACEALPAPATPVEREACLDAGIARWAPAVAAYNLTREGWVAWLEAIQLAALAQTPDTGATRILLPLVVALIRLYAGIEAALEPFEDELPIPAFPGLGILTGGE